MELNLEFAISFPSSLFFYCFCFCFYFVCLLISIQICTYAQNDSIEFIRLEELKEPTVKSIPEEQGYEW